MRSPERGKGPGRAGGWLVFEQVLPPVTLIPRQIKTGWRVSRVPSNLDPSGTGIPRTAWSSPSLLHPRSLRFLRQLGASSLLPQASSSMAPTSSAPTEGVDGDVGAGTGGAGSNTRKVDTPRYLPNLSLKCLFIAALLVATRD